MGKNKVIVIGGGASGIMAAITAARLGQKVILLERKDRIGKKILATGNGRCNISNRFIEESRFHSDSQNLYDHIYPQFDLSKTLEFFEALGIPILELDEGKLYPYSLQAASVLNVLLYELDRQNVQVICNEDVVHVDAGQRVVVHTKKNKYYGDYVILAGGGKSTPDLGSNGSGYQIAKELGMNLIEPYPSLIQLESDYAYLKHLKGTKVMAKVDLVVDDVHLKSAYGELLFTDYGLSGPPILDVSRTAAQAIKNHKKNIEIHGDLVPLLDSTALDQMLLKRIERMSYKVLEDFFVGLLPKQMIIPLIKDCGMNPRDKGAQITSKQRELIVHWLKAFRLSITGTRQWNQSQVTAGGVDCHEVVATTLTSKKYPNVILCGEILDMDGDCGGFNLQWAWSSGYVAGVSASKG
ncbi:Aminoacetone oxidase family FAD-binding enzyme [Petrocella atlantisensis]|uniref:Aminoacetone oxidase family FAD-binding enzyme n=1 Tax=Petrocella atlantisensis TaxID=2173034 RepID=A0A3P7PAZ7_9FIRM|nr:NAD(P)/FAD-dependent oxidoreductase [Petrocella atlantisensis]VDN46098.1 Aminoacetone oxidase family FAD-binding enzyme [Petrocella atlantisensis]